MKPRKPERGISHVELLIVLAISLVMTVASFPSFLTTVQAYRSAGDSRDLANQLNLSRMRAAAENAEARLYADLSAGTFQIEICTGAAPCAWTPEGGAEKLSPDVTFGYGTITTPAGQQASIGQAPACLDTSGNPIANTTCIVFNSRGIPIDSTKTPVGTGVFYITDGSSVYAVTVSATGFIQRWRTDSNSASWQNL